MLCCCKFPVLTPVRHGGGCAGGLPCPPTPAAAGVEVKSAAHGPTHCCCRRRHRLWCGGCYTPQRKVESAQNPGCAADSHA